MIVPLIRRRATAARRPQTQVLGAACVRKNSKLIQKSEETIQKFERASAGRTLSAARTPEVLTCGVEPSFI
jgi:hypothetical protein